MTEDPDSHGESLEEIATFLAGVEAFKTLSPDQLSRVAAAVTHRSVPAGEAMIVEGGLPGTQLFVLRDGTLDLLRRESLVTVMTAGELLGYPSLLTGTAPAFTVRARSDCALYCIPGDLGIELLSREDGVRWLATTQRDALLYAARSLSPLPEVQTLPVTSVVRGTPRLCDPDTPISEVARTMIAESRSAILVRARDGLGIVTDVDLREKVVAGGVSRDAPVSAIMSAPVHTIGADTLAAEASIAMLTYGVSHLPVLADDGTVVGIVSAGDLMTLEARSPFALRRALQRARDEDELVASAGDIPKLFVDLLDARLDAPVLCRVLTVLHDYSDRAPARAGLLRATARRRWTTPGSSSAAPRATSSPWPQIRTTDSPTSTRTTPPSTSTSAWWPKTSTAASPAAASSPTLTSSSPASRTGARR